MFYYEDVSVLITVVNLTDPGSRFHTYSNVVYKLCDVQSSSLFSIPTSQSKVGQIILNFDSTKFEIHKFQEK